MKTCGNCDHQKTDMKTCGCCGNCECSKCETAECEKPKKELIPDVLGVIVFGENKQEV